MRIIGAKNTAATGKETGRLHTVEAGQTLSEIAAAYKTTQAAIIKANNMANANQLRIGQELFIPDP
jgi:LysM repeat protein